ncbi:hypothetical protein XSR1_650002 [Xenorhabdus szentirmaii DSM 16338]|uniref:Uncharacterized protein n=1 Tax=Xenorhabdus szentirmaii DSM 16338 TaxID=1427518 RepID=W1J6S1_9GAMM|nr:hypothetical protein XSR1_650002 [Xenorhabdus szentirmaii DSM 16338]
MPVRDNGSASNELNAADKAASDAITFQQSILNLESHDIQALAGIRAKTCEAIAALNAATVYEENAGLVSDAVNHLSGFLAAVARSSMAGGQ